jgi:xylulokinase
MNEYILGIDVGTSGVKTGLLNLSNYELDAIAARGYDSSARQDSTGIWQMTAEAIKESVGKVKGKCHINAIGISGQMHGTVLYDGNGKVISPIINWKDDSCNKPIIKYGGKTTVEKIVEILGRDGLEDLGIDTIASGFLVATVFYLKENKKSLFDKIKHAVLPTDFIRGNLLGECDFSTDQTNAFSTGIFNTKLNKWHDEFITRLGLPISIFPTVHYTSSIAGRISSRIADFLGIEKNIPVIYGGGDNQMSMLGSGLYSPNSPTLINIGTGAQVSRITGEYKKTPGVDTRSFFDGNFVFVGASLGGGASYQWLKEEIRNSNGIDIEFAELDSLASQAPPCAGGLRFYTGPTRKEPDRLMGFSDNIKHIENIGYKARAVMEGIILELYTFSRLFEADNHKHMIAAGNALQKSPLWLQIAADIFGKAYRITDFENAVFGTTLMAGKGSGAIKNIEEAITAIKYREIIPNEMNSEIYRRELGIR